MVVDAARQERERCQKEANDKRPVVNFWDLACHELTDRTGREHQEDDEHNDGNEQGYLPSFHREFFIRHLSKGNESRNEKGGQARHEKSS